VHVAIDDVLTHHNCSTVRLLALDAVAHDESRFRAGDVSLRELASLLGRTSTAGAQIVEKLVCHGDITRTRADHDRRCSRIELTPHVREGLPIVWRAADVALADLTRSLDDADKSRLLAQLRQIDSVASLLQWNFGRRNGLRKPQRPRRAGHF